MASGRQQSSRVWEQDRGIPTASKVMGKSPSTAWKMTLAPVSSEKTLLRTRRRILGVSRANSRLGDFSRRTLNPLLPTPQISPSSAWPSATVTSSQTSSSTIRSRTPAPWVSSGRRLRMARRSGSTSRVAVRVMLKGIKIRISSHSNLLMFRKASAAWPLWTWWAGPTSSPP